MISTHFASFGAAFSVVHHRLQDVPVGKGILLVYYLPASDKRPLPLPLPPCARSLNIIYRFSLAIARKYADFQIGEGPQADAEVARLLAIQHPVSKAKDNCDAIGVNQRERAHSHIHTETAAHKTRRFGSFGTRNAFVRLAYDECCTDRTVPAGQVRPIFRLEGPNIDAKHGSGWLAGERGSLLLRCTVQRFRSKGCSNPLFNCTPVPFHPPGDVP